MWSRLHVDLVIGSEMDLSCHQIDAFWQGEKMYDQRHDHLPRSVWKDRNRSIDGKKLDIEADEIEGLHSLSKKRIGELLFYTKESLPYLQRKKWAFYLF
jgi:hypothetical protein